MRSPPWRMFAKDFPESPHAKIIATCCKRIVHGEGVKYRENPPKSGLWDYECIDCTKSKAHPPAYVGPDDPQMRLL